MKRGTTKAFLIAPLAPLLVVWLIAFLGVFAEGDRDPGYMIVYSFSFFVVIVSYILTFLIGVPTYWFLRSFDKNSFKHYLIMATVYCLILFIFLAYSEFSEYFRGIRTTEISTSDKNKSVIFVAIGGSIMATMIAFWAIARPDRIENEKTEPV